MIVLIVALIIGERLFGPVLCFLCDIVPCEN